MSLSPSETHAVLVNYLQALQELHRRHQADYELREAHPDIHRAVDHVDRELQGMHLLETPAQVELMAQTARTPHNDLRAQVKQMCKHKSVRRHLAATQEIDSAHVQRLFHKYHLDHAWLQQLWREMDESLQRVIAYLHELLTTLDLSYQLRSLATIYAK